VKKVIFCDIDYTGGCCLNGRRDSALPGNNAKRPFAPRSPADVGIGDVVKFLRQGGKISKGQVKYVGLLPGKNDTYLGIELEHECKYRTVAIDPVQQLFYNQSTSPSIMLP
jgi:hypothetical protein